MELFISIAAFFTIASSSVVIIDYFQKRKQKK